MVEPVRNMLNPQVLSQEFIHLFHSVIFVAYFDDDWLIRLFQDQTVSQMVALMAETVQ